DVIKHSYATRILSRLSIVTTYFNQLHQSKAQLKSEVKRMKAKKKTLDMVADTRGLLLRDKFQNFYYAASFFLHPKYRGVGLLTDCRSQTITKIHTYDCNSSNSVIDIEKIEEALSDELKPVENENDLNDNTRKFNDLINENHQMLCQLTNSELISENNIEDKDLLNISSLVNSEDRDIANIFVELGLLDEDVQEQNDNQTASSQDRNDDEEDYDIDELVKAAITT
ncbi:unnamed protein product, partial [Didymodactylos carnosus]